jgi:hypothetical protein
LSCGGRFCRTNRRADLSRAFTPKATVSRVHAVPLRL